MTLLRGTILAVALAACLWVVLAAVVARMARQAGWNAATETLEPEIQAAYERGYTAGVLAGVNEVNNRAYRDGLIEGAIQMLAIYDAEGGEAMRRQVRILQGQEPHER